MDRALDAAGKQIAAAEICALELYRLLRAVRGQDQVGPTAVLPPRGVAGGDAKIIPLFPSMWKAGRQGVVYASRRMPDESSVDPLESGAQSKASARNRSSDDDRCPHRRRRFERRRPWRDRAWRRVSRLLYSAVGLERPFVIEFRESGQRDERKLRISGVRGRRPFGKTSVR